MPRAIKMEKLNVLVLDDNPFVGKTIKEKITALDNQAHEHGKNPSTPTVHVKYIDGKEHQYYGFGKSFKNAVAEKLANVPFHYLLLDLHYQHINFDATDESKSEVAINVDEKETQHITDWNLIDGRLSVSVRDYLQQTAYQTTQLFNELKSDNVKTIEHFKKSLRGIIIYTYSPNPNRDELETKKKDLADVLGINKNKIEIIAAQQEFFQTADFELYKTHKITSGLVSIGLKSNYKLYGALLGAMLYHKIMGKHREQKSKSRIRLFLSYLLAVSIALGNNGLYDFVRGQMGINPLFISAFIILPVVAYLIKPQRLIDADAIK